MSLVRSGGKIKYFSIAFFLSNICAKIYQNRFMYVGVIARQSSDIFGTQCILRTLGPSTSIGIASYGALGYIPT